MFHTWPRLELVPVVARYGIPDTLAETTRLIDDAPAGTTCENRGCTFKAVRATANYDPVAYYACMACLWSEWWWNEGRDEGLSWDELTARIIAEDFLQEWPTNLDHPTS